LSTDSLLFILNYSVSDKKPVRVKFYLYIGVEKAVVRKLMLIPTGPFGEVFPKLIIGEATIFKNTLSN